MSTKNQPKQEQKQQSTIQQKTQQQKSRQEHGPAKQGKSTNALRGEQAPQDQEHAETRMTR